MSANEQNLVPQQPQSPPLMDEREFAAKIRAKHPNVYDTLDDAELSRRVLNKYPEYRPHVRLSDAALRPSVTSTVNENADFTNESGPIKDFKPIDFRPLDTEDLTFMQRAATGFQKLAGADRSSLIRDTQPSLQGKPFTITIQSQDGRRPSDAELTDALLDGLGEQAREVNRRYQTETGRPIVTPAISDELLSSSYDPQTKSFRIPIAPPQEAIAAINGYGQGGLEGAHQAVARLRGIDHEAAEKQRRALETAREMIRRLGVNPDDLSNDSGPVLKGIARAGLNATRLANNVSALWRDPASASRDAEYIEQVSQSIPREKSGIGRVVEGVTELGTTAPQYMMAGPYGAGLVAYTQNLNRGTEDAVKEGLKLGVAGGVAHGTGIAVENLSPLARQVIARHMAGMTNVGLEKLSGGEKSAVESYLQAALLPVGKGSREETGPTFDYVHGSLGGLKRSPDQAGLKEGFVRVFDSEGNEFVARKPNPEGVGGIHNTDGSLPALRPGARFLDVVNVPRAVQTSYDLSAIGRQGLILSVLHPVKAARNFARSVPTLFSEGAADKILGEIHSSPFAPLRRESGLYLSDYHKANQPLTKGEEGFQSSIAQSIPGVRASERAYVTFLDKMRADTFDSYAETHPDATPETLQGIASFINKATGRGDLGKWGEQHAQALSQAFYSPRYQLSRAQLPLEMFKGTPESRAYAARNLVQFVSSGIAMMGIAKLAGLQVGTNPLSSDFGKIKIGNTRVDIWGGSSQLARYTAQMIAGKATELESGRTVPRSRLQTAINFLRTKAAPQIHVPLDTALGSEASGQPANLRNLPRRLLMPLAWRDIEEAIRDDLQSGGHGYNGAAKGALSLLGFGINTITPATEDERIQAETNRLRSKPETKGMTDEQITHNAKVNLEIHRLLQIVDDDKELTESQRDELRHAIDSRFYYGRVRENERRPLSAIQRVFTERMKGAEEDLRKRIKTIKSPASLANPQDGKLPAEYYRSNSLDILKAAARQNVLNHPGYLSAQIHPTVLAAYGGDMNKIHRSLLDGTLAPGMAFSEAMKGVALQREIEASDAETARLADEFDRAIDATSRDYEAHPVTFPLFEHIFNQYQADLLSARGDDERMLLEQQFEQFLKGTRLVSDTA